MLENERSRPASLSDEEMIVTYTDQPQRLPEELREVLEQKWGKGSIWLYTCVDLDARFQLTEQWLVLGESELALAKPASTGWTWHFVPRSRIRGVRELIGLSAHRLIFEDGPEVDPLLVVRYTHRQSRGAGLIKFLIEQDAKAGSEGARPDVSADEAYMKQLLSPIKEAQASVAGHQMKVIWRLLRYLLPYRRQVAFGFLGATAMTLLSLVPAFLTGHVIDNVIKPFQSGQITLAEARSMVAVTILALIATYAMREFFAWVRLRKMAILGEFVARDLRDQVYRHLHTLSLSFFSSKQTGSLISRVGSDTDRIWDFIAFGFVEVTTSLILLAGLSVMLISLDVPLGLLVTLPVPFVLYAIYRHGENMQGLFLRAWRKWSNLTDCLSDTIPGIRVVKAFHREAHETARFERRNAAVTGEFTRIHRAWTGFWPLLILSIQAIVVLVWVFGVPRVLEHVVAFQERGPAALGVGLSPGTFVSFILYLGMFIQPIDVIGQMARMVNRATSSAHRVFEVLDTEPQITVVRDPVRLSGLRGEVEYKDVTFSYDGVRKILKGISFHARPGEMVGLVGASGSGKTTLVNLLARFYDVESGEIRIDGVDLRRAELGTYRQQIGIVLQDPYLFHGSILENIRYANPEASLDQVVAAARAANAHDFICKLPHGYDTVVGERGQSLSGGERQRVSIARAILRDPRILILDEATSAVDTETERKIQEALDRLVAGRTVFAIAHRLSTLKKADRLLVMENGQLVEAGTHAELLARPGGVYRKLVQLQQDMHENRLS